MKKCFALILSIIYITTSIGAVIQAHYCMGEFVEWGLKDKKSDNCSICGMKKGTGASEGCCKDEQKRVNLDKHNAASLSSLTIEKSNFHASAYIISEITCKINAPVISRNIFSNSPPGSELYAIYLLNNVFRI